MWHFDKYVCTLFLEKYTWETYFTTISLVLSTLCWNILLLIKVYNVELPYALFGLMFQYVIQLRTSNHFKTFFFFKFLHICDLKTWKATNVCILLNIISNMSVCRMSEIELSHVRLGAARTQFSNRFGSTRHQKLIFRSSNSNRFCSFST